MEKYSSFAAKTNDIDAISVLPTYLVEMKSVTLVPEKHHQVVGYVNQRIVLLAICSYCHLMEKRAKE